MLSRRNFIKMASVAPVVSTGKLHFANELFSETSSADKAPTIKSIKLFNVSGSFNRFVGMNAYGNTPKGILGTQQMAQVVLANGLDGLTVKGYTSIDDDFFSRVRELIGKDPFTFYTWDGDKITGVKKDMKSYFFDSRYAWIEGAILDVIGKLKNVPVWKLFGESVRDGIDAYDGSLYFEDVVNNKDVEIIADVGRRMKNDGYRGIKIKLGRPFKMIQGEEGVQRDIDAFIALREAVGWNFNLMADANRGYERFDWAVKLMKACAPYGMYWMEELFAHVENNKDDTLSYIKLRDELLKENFYIPIAEGENIRELDLFNQYIEDGVYNFLQPDTRTSGVSYILDFARRVAKYRHVKIVPHNWQSQLGMIMSLHLSKICHNIPMVEDDRFFNHAFMGLKYQFQDGQWHVPDEPGWGLMLAPDYKQFCTEEEVVIS